MKLLLFDYTALPMFRREDKAVKGFVVRVQDKPDSQPKPRLQPRLHTFNPRLILEDFIDFSRQTHGMVFTEEPNTIREYRQNYPGYSILIYEDIEGDILVNTAKPRSFWAISPRMDSATSEELELTKQHPFDRIFKSYVDRINKDLRNVEHCLL